ncbi:MAG TPA: thioesterase family protein [Bryobacteraceae bacterium]|jgi:predicted thioesterase|nr:thioesterase family protein [Bryobacteraceae bacterium]
MERSKMLKSLACDNLFGMHNIRIGATEENRLLVTEDVAIAFLELPEARVLSTPNMILHMEQTCRNLVLPFLEPGHDTVGTHVNVFHRAAAPVGSLVTFTSEITAVDDRRVLFRVAARTEDDELIGEGTHERTIINITKFASRLAERRRAKV